MKGILFLVPTLCVGTQLPNAVRRDAEDAERSVSRSHAELGNETERRSVKLTEVARASGIDFNHFDPVTEKQYISETIGSGAAWIDYDGDGYLDLVLINSAPIPGAEHPPDKSPLNRVYRNRSNPSPLPHAPKGRGESLLPSPLAAEGPGVRSPQSAFEDVSEQVWTNAPGFGQGSAVGDFDNDGFDDLYISYYLRPNRLYRNNGDGTFQEIGSQAKVEGVSGPSPEPEWSTSCAWADLDGDGNLDLYVCNYVDMPINDYPFCGDKRRNIRTVCSPAKFPGLPDVVYRNLGDGRFADSSEEWGFRPETGRGLGVVVADLDDDGLPDVYVANDLSPNLFYRNLGGGRFQEQGLLSGCALSADGKAQAGMGVDVGDVDGDGRMDIFVTNFFREPNSLYRNDGGGQFREISGRSGLGRPSYLKLGFGCGFFDADNDGNLDVFVVNGHIDRNPEKFGTPEPYRQPAQLFMGNGKGRFEGINDLSAGSYLTEPHVGRAAAFADFDNDGRMDIAVNNNGEAAALLHNETIGGHWLRLVLVGTRSNRNAVGAKVTVTAGDLTRVHQVAGGRSYLSAHDLRPLLGLGEAREVSRLEIRWPDGKMLRLDDVGTDQTILVREQDATPLNVTDRCHPAWVRCRYH